jgi:hypothetical protein
VKAENFIPIVAIGLLVAGLWAVGDLAYLCGRHAGRREMRQEAVVEGYGEYYIISLDDGDAGFDWRWKPRRDQ